MRQFGTLLELKEGYIKGAGDDQLKEAAGKVKPAQATVEFAKKLAEAAKGK